MPNDLSSETIEVLSKPLFIRDLVDTGVGFSEWKRTKKLHIWKVACVSLSEKRNLENFRRFVVFRNSTSTFFR
jgi:hypothetical protein